MRALSYLIVVMLFSGCLELEQTVTIAADGSGTQKVDLTIPDKVLRAVQQQSAARHPRGKTTDMTAVYDRSKVEADLKERGLALTEHKVENVRRGRKATVAARFDSLQELRRSSLGTSRTEWVFGEGSIPGTIVLTLYPQGRAAWEEARRKVQELAKRPGDPIVKSYFERQKVRLEGLDVRITLNLPGTVIKACGPVKETGLKQVQVRVQACDIKTPADLILALAPCYQVVFDGRGCTFPVAKRKGAAAKGAASRASALGATTSRPSPEQKAERK